MARFDMTGFEDVEKALIQRGDAVAKAIPAMLKAGAGVLVTAQQGMIASLLAGKRSTGDLRASIKASPVRSNGASGQYIEVYPHGNNRRGERNATVGFVHEYGRANMPARPWMTAANEAAEAEAREAMRAAWGEHNGG